MTESEPWSYHPDGSPVYSLAEIIRRRAAATPAGIALAEAGRLTSFAELDRRSSRVARPCRPGECGPVTASPSSGPLARSSSRSSTARPRSGRSSPPSTNRLAAREVLDILADAEPRVLIVDRSAAALVADVASRGFDCRVLVTDAALSEAELLSWTRGRLAHFKCPVGVSSGPLPGPHGLRQAPEAGHQGKPDHPAVCFAPGGPPAAAALQGRLSARPRFRPEGGAAPGAVQDRQDDERGSLLPDINLVPGQQVATLP